MDAKGNIKPLDEFPEEERKAAEERLRKFQEDREAIKEELLTPRPKPNWIRWKTSWNA